MNIITITGIAASVFTATSLIPQLIKILKKKEAADISLLMLIVLFTGLALWTLYGFLKKDWIIIVSNGFSLLVNALIGFFTIRYKK